MSTPHLTKHDVSRTVADTSIEAYRSLNLAGLEAKVLWALGAFPVPPTAYELYRWMQSRRLAVDLNAVRPRLTKLHAAGRVVRGEKRTCEITGRTVYTWAVR